jgi:ATP-dependent Clp protease ATP-binding subunit ClpA
MIFMTSNLGAVEMGGLVDGGIGFTPQALGRELERLSERMESTALDAARRRFAPEFLNRIDHTVVFQPLADPQLRTILDMELDRVQDRVLAAGHASFLFHLSEPAKDFLLQEGVDRRYGARHLKRAIERHLVRPLASLVASGQVRQGDSIAIDCAADCIGDSGSMSFRLEDGGATLPALPDLRGAPAAAGTTILAARTAKRKAENK